MNERTKEERKEELNEELNGCITKLQSWRNMDDTMRSSMSQKKNHWNKCVHEQRLKMPGGLWLACESFCGDLKLQSDRVVKPDRVFWCVCLLLLLFFGLQVWLPLLVAAQPQPNRAASPRCKLSRPEHAVLGRQALASSKRHVSKMCLSRRQTLRSQKGQAFQKISELGVLVIVIHLPVSSSHLQSTVR